MIILKEWLLLGDLGILLLGVKVGYNFRLFFGRGWGEGGGDGRGNVFITEGNECCKEDVSILSSLVMENFVLIGVLV